MRRVAKDSAETLGADRQGLAVEASWHALPAEEVLARLGSTPDGLTDEEAARRLEAHGPNALPEEKPTPPILRFLRQFHDVLIYVLLVAAAFTAFLGEWVDTGVILAVVLVNAVIGFVQEGRAEAALTAIREMLSLGATVLRGGRRRQVAAAALVPGDVVLLESGDRVPADVRLLVARGARAEEAALTGESEPVAKSAEPVSEDAVLGDRRSMAYSSTLITSGRLTGVVVATGTETEIGRIGEMVARVETLTTPLLRAIGRFGKTLSAAILGLGAALFAFGYAFRDFSVAELFLIVVSLAVAAIPEGLPAIITITLALGVQRMARRNAIVRRLPAVETLGAVTVICSDKTGTLTKNEMTVKEVVLPDQTVAVGGTGYAPEGGLEEPPDDALLGLARAGLLASDAELRQDAEGRWVLEGDPTEGAVVTLALKAGLDRAEVVAAYPRLDEIPFESERRFMATLHETPDGGRVIHLKGAPEKVFSLCDVSPDLWEARMDALAARGYRVLAVAAKDTDAGTLGPEEVAGGFTLLGLLGIIDPPRPEAVAAVRECREAGIKVKMITGDHAMTAKAIGAQLGIGDGRSAVTGQDIEHMDDAALRRAVLEHDIFARSSPEHKLRLVQALQAQGEVAAMTGDGVNDAPALKRADVGVAMGIKGSEAAKSAAEMVLADDNFATIEQAVLEGRTIYDNLKKTILFILPTNGAEALIVLATVVLALSQLPITPVQILWVNMITAVTLALALAFEPPEPGIMRRPPRDPGEPILSPYLLWRVAFVSVVIATLSLLLFFYELQHGLSLESARTVAVNVLVAGQVFYLFNARRIMGPSLSRHGLLGNRVALGAAALLVGFQLAFTYVPILQFWFGTAPIGFRDWLLVLGAGLLVFVLVELEKWLVRTWRAQH